MAETIIERDTPKIPLNDSVVESEHVNVKAQESAEEEEEENGDELQFEIPDDSILEAEEIAAEAGTEVGPEDRTEDGTEDGTQNNAEVTETEVKNKVVKMRGADDYLGRKNDLTKYENRKDSVTRLDNKIGKSSDPKDLKQDSKNIQIDDIQKSEKSEVRESLESDMFYEDEIEDSRMPLCKFKNDPE